MSKVKQEIQLQILLQKIAKNSFKPLMSKVKPEVVTTPADGEVTFQTSNE